MNKLMMSALTVVAGVGLAVAAPKGVPETLEGVRTIVPDAGTRNHVLIANVNKAVPDEDWRLIVNCAASRINVNIWTNDLASIDCRALVTNPASVKMLAKDPKAVTVVFICDGGDVPDLLSVPRSFSCVNLAWLKADKPSRQVYRDRVAKQVLRGIAGACGSGATVEPRCSLFYAANTLAGLDKVNICISPMAYYPMVEILRQIGGSEAVTPVPEKDEE